VTISVRLIFQAISTDLARLLFPHQTVSILQGGSFFGALGAAPLNNAIGRKRSIMVGCAIFIVGGVLQTAGMTLSYQYAGRFLAGLGIGVSTEGHYRGVRGGLS
jgi:MFS family permease